MKQIKSIMLIDDEEVVNFINKKIIERLNITELVQVFSSGTQALDYLKLIQTDSIYDRLFAPQLILLDINMPNMDGFEFLDEFDKLKIFKQKPIDIFMLSSSFNPADIDRANKYKNCSGYFTKPLDADKLMQHFNLTRQQHKN